MGMFVISKRQNGDYKFVFTSRKGKTIFTSIALKKKQDCESMINGLAGHIHQFSFRKKSTPSGKHYFRLIKGGFVLATSRKYSTSLMLSKGIDEILKYRSEEHTSELQSRENLVCRLLLENYVHHRHLHSFPTRRSSDLDCESMINGLAGHIHQFSFRKKSTPSGKHYFRLIKGGFVLATSRKYSTSLMLSKGIDEILKY